MSERTEFRPKPIEGIVEFQRRLNEKEAVITGFMQSAVTAYQETRAAEQQAREALNKDAEYLATPADERWRVQSKFLNDILRPYFDRQIETKDALRVALREYYQAVEAAGQHISVSEGQYTAEVLYPARNEDRLMELRIRHYDGPLSTLLGSFRGTLSMEGLHNFGLQTERAVGCAQVDFNIKNDQGFYFGGKCWVDGGGHIVKGDRELY